MNITFKHQRTRLTPIATVSKSWVEMRCLSYLKDMTSHTGPISHSLGRQKGLSISWSKHMISSNSINYRG